jgi:UPF0755 protein
MNKDVLNKVIGRANNAIQELRKRVSSTYKNQFLPLIKKVVDFVSEISKLIKKDAKEDNKEFCKYIADDFNGLVLYRKIAKDKTRKLIVSWRNSLANRKRTKPVVSKKITHSPIEVFGNLVKHIKYLSYKRLIIYCLVFVTLDIFLMWFGTYRILYAKHYWEGTQEKKFFIRPGKNLDEIIDDLKQNDVLKSRFIFKVYVKLSGKENQIISKRYIFNNGISNSELLNLLTDRNMVQMEKFTLIEGLRIKQIAKITETKLQLSGERFIKETENDSLINMLGLKGKAKNLEGFLFPDTYYLPLDVDEKGLVNILFNEFRKRVLNDNEVISGLKERKNKLLEVITLASIIQGETNVKEEMPTISGVYHNRIRKNMRLEADPTVQYALPDGPKPKLKYSDLKIDSPYNTYRYFGLPPGPINNPGLYAIRAAINPENNNLLFFVATGNGGHKFTETYREHLKAVEEYKKNTEKKIEQ